MSEGYLGDFLLVPQSDPVEPITRPKVFVDSLATCLLNYISTWANTSVLKCATWGISSGSLISPQTSDIGTNTFQLLHQNWSNKKMFGWCLCSVSRYTKFKYKEVTIFAYRSFLYKWWHQGGNCLSSPLSWKHWQVCLYTYFTYLII